MKPQPLKTQKIPLWITGCITGILLGLSYPNYPEYPLGILAWFAFIPVLLALKNVDKWKDFFKVVALILIIVAFLGFWWTSFYNLKAFFGCFFTQFSTFYLPIIIFFGCKKRIGWHRAMIMFPFLWAFSDWATHLLPHNLQVLNIAYSQANMPYFIQYADFTGMWGIEFWVIMLNVLLTFCIIYQKKRYYSFSIIWFASVLIYSFWVININPKGAIGSESDKTKIGLIQTNIDSYADNDTTIGQKTFNQILTLSDSAIKNHQPDLLILPEASIPFTLFKDSVLLSYIRENIINWNTPVALGYADYSKDNKSFTNKALVFTPTLAAFYDSLKIKESDVMVYQKEYGLPFMEYMPYFDNVESMRGRKLIRGNEPYIFKFGTQHGNSHKVALTICWEQTYPAKMASLVSQGAEFVALMNNDAWFGKTPGAKFLLSFTKLRAIENRRSIARCSNGGISCFVDPFGRIYGKIPWFTENISVQEVLCVTKLSFYTKHPNWFPIFCGIILLLLIIAFLMKPHKHIFTS